MSATDGEIVCTGEAFFNVFPRQVTPVGVMLNCKAPPELGGVRVNGKINFCADIEWAVVSPLQTSIGNQIDVKVAADDVEGDTIEYRWTATSGSFAKRSVITRSRSRFPTTASTTAIASGTPP
jgi:Fe-S cluster assembly ATPase SufC